MQHCTPDPESEQETNKTGIMENNKVSGHWVEILNKWQVLSIFLPSASLNALGQTRKNTGLH